MNSITYAYIWTTLEKKYLKIIASEILVNGPFIRIDLRKSQYYCSYLTLLILNSINLNKQNWKEILRYTITVKFGNKAVELIRLPQIFNLSEVVFQLLDKLKSNDNNPTVTYQLGKTIRNKILNYKEAVNSIYGDEDVSFCLNSDQCDYADSSFCDPRHKHIITKDIRIIKNKILRKLLTKGPNYRQLQTINLSKALIEITNALHTCIESMMLKTKYATPNLKL